MKKRNYIKIALASVMAMTLLNSCLKDPRYVDFAGSPNVIELPAVATIGALQTVAITSSATATATNAILVNLASPTTSGSAINVKFKIASNDVITAYNKANGTNFLPLPAADYTSSLAVTIPAGQREANLVININSSLINIDSSNYVIPVTISDPGSGNLISANYNTALINVLIKNVYDGNYSLKGFVFRNDGTGANDASLGGNFTGLVQALSTEGPSTVSLAPVWKTGVGAAGVTGTSLTINPTTNAVTVSSTGNASLTNATGYNSHYDPTTKTIYVSYTWGSAPNNRAETDTLTYVSPQ
jgi:hypothetical protein